MKIFLSVLILIFGLQSWVKADDIRDFEIEGMSVGDSLLDYYNLSEIKKAISLIDNKCLIEVSGIKKPEDIKKYKDLPIHYISLGDLTKNIESIDFSLNIS